MSSESIPVSLQSAHQGLALTLAEYPEWTAPAGASAEEACALAARWRAYWREEMRPRSPAEVIAKARLTGSLRTLYTDFLRPAVVAEAELALSHTPPPCTPPP